MKKNKQKKQWAEQARYIRQVVFIIYMAVSEIYPSLTPSPRRLSGLRRRARLNHNGGSGSKREQLLSCKNVERLFTEAPRAGGK